MDKKYHVALDEEMLDDPFNPETLFPLERIVGVLSRICRWNGRCNQFYSVLDHSINLSLMVPPEFAVQALVHDFAEAYTGDWPAPLKKMPEMAWFTEREKTLEKRIWNFYAGVSEISPVVMEYDRIIARMEANRLGLGGEWSRGIGDDKPWLFVRNTTVKDFFDTLIRISAFSAVGGVMGEWVRGGNNAKALPHFVVVLRDLDLLSPFKK